MWVRPDAADLTVLSVLADAGALSVHVVGAFPLSHAADAHRLSVCGGTHGKIVVVSRRRVGLRGTRCPRGRCTIIQRPGFCSL